MDKSKSGHKDVSLGSEISDMKGSGTESNPYVITTVRHLQAIQNNLEANFILGCDIDASETESWNDGHGFEPIASEKSPFTGCLSGQGFSINNLHINRPDENNVGLFSAIGYSGLVENIIFENNTVCGQHNVATIVGCNKQGDVLNCKVNNSNILGNHIVGGAIGWNAMEDSVAAKINSEQVTVKGQESVGGVIGENEGHIYEISTKDPISIGQKHSGSVIGFSEPS